MGKSASLLSGLLAAVYWLLLSTIAQASPADGADASIVTISGSVPLHVPLEPSAKLLLDGNDFFFLNAQQEFSFAVPNTNSTHILQIVSHRFAFERIRIDVNQNEGKASFYIYEHGWDLNTHGSPLPSLDGWPPLGAFHYFMERESFNVWGIFANPMMLISLFTLGLIFVLPKIKETIQNNPELKAVRSSAHTRNWKKRPGNEHKTGLSFQTLTFPTQ
ncbi:hypothetical protein HDV03_003166 [Kappamyces sp. JEL0829]|nr:hypothetical protein HDV03_003166 [Kappamyces sp. JEL0829]